MQDTPADLQFTTPVSRLLDGQEIHDFPLIVFNPIAWERTELIRVIITDDVTPADAYLPLARVLNDDGVALPCQVHAVRVNGMCCAMRVCACVLLCELTAYACIGADPLQLENFTETSTSMQLLCLLTLPPLSLTTVFVSVWPHTVTLVSACSYNLV